MNCLGIDFGIKNIGLAYSRDGFIFTLKSITNDGQVMEKLAAVIKEYDIHKIYLGLSEGAVARKTLAFASRISSVLKLPVETVEEAVSTIEGTDIYLKNHGPKRRLPEVVDSISAAVILRRVISSN